jgi:hypothetical protein
MSKLGKEIASGHQPMFMTPDEVVEHYHLGDGHYFENPNKLGPKNEDQKRMDEQTLNYKLEDSKHPQSYDGYMSLHDSIKEVGVRNPIQIGRSPYIPRPIITNGHHRLAVARNLNPQQFLPLDYH